MPEGDTIHKLAAAFRPALEGRPLEGLWLRDRGWLPGLRGLPVSDVSAVGKHMLVAVGAAEPPAATWVLHVHLGMRGRWHAYARGDAWQRPARDAVARIESEKTSFVCFRAAKAEVLRGVDLALHPALARLGPDLLADRFDVAEALTRARAREPRTVSDLLLDQRVACGIGNVYRCEVLFLEGIHPEAPLASLSDARLADLYRLARRLMLQNLGGWRRSTVRVVDREHPTRPGETRLWVYNRAELPCLRCNTRVRSSRAGDAARATWWCPGCQKR
ncbi:MAG: DNA-formamidopyrimidine glycosylase family protein [Myxococcota bacterium]|nr:DNA-formamidopyrimidine glycosylase family protein [Myxococcota bacterium]